MCTGCHLRPDDRREAICHPTFANIVSDIALLQTLGSACAGVWFAPANDEAPARAGIQAQYHKRIRVTDDASFAITGVRRSALRHHRPAPMGLANTPWWGPHQRGERQPSPPSRRVG